MNGLDPSELSRRLRQLIETRVEGEPDDGWLDSVFDIVRALQSVEFPADLGHRLRSIPGLTRPVDRARHGATVVADSRLLDAVSPVRGDLDASGGWTQVLSCPVADVLLDVTPTPRAEADVRGQVLRRVGPQVDLDRVVVAELDGPAALAEVTGDRFVLGRVPATMSRLVITSGAWRISADIDLRGEHG